MQKVPSNSPKNFYTIIAYSFIRYKKKNLEFFMILCYYYIIITTNHILFIVEKFLGGLRGPFFKKVP